MTKQQAISKMILDAVDMFKARNGGQSNGTVRDAVDFVLGEGTFDRIASDVWEAAQAKG